MSELPDEEVRRIKAFDAVIKQGRSLDLVRQRVEGATFNGGQGLLFRWADGTRNALAEWVSAEEAQRFEDQMGLYTFDSLEQQLQTYSDYLDGLVLTLQHDPEQLLQPAPPQPELIAPLPGRPMAATGDAVESTKFDRAQTWWKNKWSVVVLVLLIAAVGAIGAVASSVKNVGEAIQFVSRIFRRSPAEPALTVELRNLPFLMKTNFDTTLKMATVTNGGLTNPDAPHNLFMIVIQDVTIWNKSADRVSLQFEFRTASADEKKAPITLLEHGPERSISKFPGVMPIGPDKWAFLEGPLNIDSSSFVKGPLAFFYQQNDGKPANIDFANGELIITDKLSDKLMAFELKDAVWTKKP